MGSLGNRNTPIDNDLRNTRRTDKTGPGRGTKEPEILPVVKVQLFNSKKATGEAPKLEGIKVGFKRTDVIPITTTQTEKPPADPLTRTTEPRQKNFVEPKLNVTGMPKKGELLGKLKPLAREPSDTSPNKLFKRGIAFDADFKLGDEAEQIEETQSRGKAEREGLEDSLRATKASNKFSMETRPLQRMSSNPQATEGSKGDGEPKKDLHDSTSPTKFTGDRSRKYSDRFKDGGGDEERFSASPTKPSGKQGDRFKLGRGGAKGDTDGPQTLRVDEEDELEYRQKKRGDRDHEENRRGDRKGSDLRATGGKDRRGKGGDLAMGKIPSRNLDAPVEYVVKQDQSPGKEAKETEGEGLDLSRKIIKVLETK